MSASANRAEDAERYADHDASCDFQCQCVVVDVIHCVLSWVIRAEQNVADNGSEVVCRVFIVICSPLSDLQHSACRRRLLFRPDGLRSASVRTEILALQPLEDLQCALLTQHSEWRIQASLYQLSTPPRGEQGRCWKSWFMLVDEC